MVSRRYRGRARAARNIFQICPLCLIAFLTVCLLSSPINSTRGVGNAQWENSTTALRREPPSTCPGSHNLSLLFKAYLRNISTTDFIAVSRDGYSL